MSLYNCKLELDREGRTAYRITKFDPYLTVQSSYLCTDQSCECPASRRSTPCRHRKMLPKFIRDLKVNAHLFLDYERGLWLDADGNVWSPPVTEAREITPAAPSPQPELPLECVGDPPPSPQAPTPKSSPGFTRRF